MASKINELEGRLLRCEKVTYDLKEENVSLKARSMRDNVIFFNIPEQDGHTMEDCTARIRDFCREQLRINQDDMHAVGFDRVHRMGGKQPGKGRPIVAKCANDATKRIIFAHTRNLAGTRFGVSEQIPREINERRGHLMSQYKQAKEDNKKPRWNLDQLIVEGRTIKKTKDETSFSTAIPFPSASIHIKHSNVRSDQGSSFQGHLASIDDSAEVVPVLHHLFTNHAVAKATHNIYAYRIVKNKTIIENSCDDGEFGAGRKLLEILKEEKKLTLYW